MGATFSISHIDGKKTLRVRSTHALRGQPRSDGTDLEGLGLGLQCMRLPPCPPLAGAEFNPLWNVSLALGNQRHISAQCAEGNLLSCVGAMAEYVRAGGFGTQPLREGDSL